MKKIILFGYLIIASFGLSAQNQWNIVGESVRTVPDLVSDSNFVLSAPSRAALRQGQANWVPASSGGSASYLVYTALLTQSGTSAPVATVLENTLGGTVVWSYDDVGVYIGTLAGAFVIGQTACIMSPISGGTSRLSPHSFNPDFVELYVYDLSDAGADDYLVSTFVEIRVYP